jgi:uncharacterized membrane protein YbhN (UPF0104 family)
MPDEKKPKNPWIKRLGIPLAAIPLIWIYWRLDFHAMIAMLPKIAWWTIPVLVTATLASMVIQGIRWWLLLRAFTDEISLPRALAYHFSSIYYSMVLPTSAAQEVVRTLFVVKKAGPAVSWGAAWICKITAASLSLIFALYGLLHLSGTGLPRGTMTGIIIFCGILAVALLVSFSKRLSTPLRPIVAAIIPSVIIKKIEFIREGIYQYRHKKSALLLTLVLTLIIQLLFVGTLTFVIEGVCGKLFFWECLAYMPLIEIVSMSQPLTPNGMGVREALTALMFKHIGLSNEQLGIYVLLILTSNLLKLFGAIPVVHGILKRRNERFTSTDCA